MSSIRYSAPKLGLFRVTEANDARASCARASSRPQFRRSVTAATWNLQVGLDEPQTEKNNGRARTRRIGTNTYVAPKGLCFGMYLGKQHSVMLSHPSRLFAFSG